MAKKGTWYRFTFADGYVSICMGMSAQELSVEEAKHGKLISKVAELRGKAKDYFAVQAQNGRAGALPKTKHPSA